MDISIEIAAEAPPRVRNALRQRAFFLRSMPWRIEMPAKSKAQQKAAGAALAAKRGEQKVSSLKGASKSMYESMSEKQLEDFASTERESKPEHASKKK
jgi:hypothetical protein